MSIKLIFRVVLVPLVFTIIGAFLGVVAFKYYNSRPEMEIKNFYAAEMATVVSPQTVKKYIDDGNKNYVLVDLRSQGEYEKEHAKTAVNIPAGSMNEEQLVAAFRKLPEGREVIVHCYSAYCTLGRQVGKALSENGIYVKEMTIGWSEWRYHWDLWNPGAANDAGKDYVVTGKADPANTPIIPCTVGEFGC